MKTQEEKYKAVIKTIFHDILSGKNFNLLDTVCDKDAVFYDGKEKIVGVKAIMQLVKERSLAVPDFLYTIDDIIIQGNKAAVRWHAKGGALRSIAGFQAFHPANYWGISMFQFENSLIVKNWANSSVVDTIPEK